MALTSYRGGQTGGELERIIRDDRRNDRMEGNIAYEDANRTRAFDFYTVNVELSEEIIRRINTTEQRSLAIAIAPFTVNPKTTSALFEQLMDLVVQRAARRFGEDKTFPRSVITMQDPTIQEIMFLCSVKKGGEFYSLQETAVRTVIAAAGLLTQSDCEDDDQFPTDKDELSPSGAPDSISQEEMAQLIASVGTCLAIIAVAKPFVNRVTNAVNQMCLNMIQELSLPESSLTRSVFSQMFEGYFRRIELKELAGYLVNRKFPGWQWGTTYAARYGAGTSHLNCISTFMHRFPSCPAWSFVDRSEYENYVEALDLIKNDPLALYPVTRTPDLSLDKYRTTAMPGLVIISVVGLVSSGDPNWGRYQNLPYIPMVGRHALPFVIGFVQEWVRARMTPETLDDILNKSGGIFDIFEDTSELPIGGFVQTGGKLKSAVQRGQVGQ